MPEATWHGHQLELKGTFAGTLMRVVLTDEGMWTGRLTDPMEIEGEFHIWKANYAGQ